MPANGMCPCRVQRAAEPALAQADARFCQQVRSLQIQHSHWARIYFSWKGQNSWVDHKLNACCWICQDSFGGWKWLPLGWNRLGSCHCRLYKPVLSNRTYPLFSVKHCCCWSEKTTLDYTLARLEWQSLITPRRVLDAREEATCLASSP